MAKGKLYPGVAVMQTGAARGHTFKTMVGSIAKEYPLHIDATTLSQIAEASKKFKNGVKVKDGHGGKTSDIVGSINNFSVSGDTLRGDLTLNTSRDAGEAIADAIDAMPDTFGLSAYFTGAPEIIGDTAYARCTELSSVDFEPETAATPSGMFRVGNNRMSVDNKNKDMDTAEFAAYKTACEARFAQIETDVKAAKGAMPAANVPGQTAQMDGIKAVVTAAIGEATANIVKLTSDEIFLKMSKVQGLATPLAAAPVAAPANVPTPVTASPGEAKFEDLIATTLKNGQAKDKAAAIQFCFKNYPKEALAFRARQESGEVITL